MRNTTRARSLQRLPRPLAASVSVALGLAIGVAMILISIAGASQGAATPTRATEVPTDGTSMGFPGAKVSIVLYADFQCGHCLTLHNEVEPKIIDEYVKTGFARLEVRQIGALGPESMQSAQAADCAAEQNRFWDYRDELYRRFARNGPSAFFPAELRAAADSLKLDSQAWSACYSGGAGKAKEAADSQKARVDGVRAVPTALINGRLIQGPTYDDLKRVIDEELTK